MCDEWGGKESEVARDSRKRKGEKESRESKYSEAPRLLKGQIRRKSAQMSDGGERNE